MLFVPTCFRFHVVIRIKSVFSALMLCAVLSACTPSYDGPGTWVRLENTGEVVHPTYDGVYVYRFVAGTLPVNAWYAKIEIDNPNVDVAVITAEDDDGRASASDLAVQHDTCLLVNAGYFRMDVTPSSHVGLVLSQGRLISNPTEGVFRDGVRYETARSAIGFTDDNSPRVGWIRARGDSLIELDHPLANRPGEPAPAPVEGELPVWSVHHAVSGGPRLLRDGHVDITVDQEVFFGSSIPNVHPRTAAGVTREGDLVLMVVDGRQSGSRGVSLEELADLMLSAGATDAINLDGGGSSTMILGRQLVNLPTGGTFEREVASAIAVRCGVSGTPAP